jgi:phage gp46-like protein
MTPASSEVSIYQLVLTINNEYLVEGWYAGIPLAYTGEGADPQPSAFVYNSLDATYPVWSSDPDLALFTWEFASFRFIADTEYFRLAQKEDGTFQLGIFDLFTVTDLGTQNESTTQRDAGFETAVVASLFTDARAETEIKPATLNEKRGFAGSELFGFNLGSKLWLLERAPLDQTTLNLYSQYVKQALDWMVLEGIASKVECTTVRDNGRLNFLLIIRRPDAPDATLRFYINWQNQTVGNL